MDIEKNGENDSNETTLVHCRRPPVHGSRASAIVDSSDVVVDEMQSCYHTVITGHRKRVVYKGVSRSRELRT